MDPNVIKWMTFLLAVFAIIGFCIVFYLLLTAPTTQPTAEMATTAALLSGLVGGIVAAAFGHELPEPSASTSRFRRKLAAVGSFLCPVKSEPPRQVLAVVYVLCYFGISFWAIAIWLQGNKETVEIIQNLARVALGLMIAIVSGYLRPEISATTQSVEGSA